MLTYFSYLDSYFQQVEKLVETTSINKAAGGLFSPDPGLVIWTWLVFFVMLAILYRFAWKPILKSLDDRENRISKSLETASDIEKKMEEISKKNEEILLDAKKEAQKIIENSRIEADKIGIKIKQQADREALEIIEKTKLAIKEAERNAINYLKKETVFLSIEIASKLIDENLDNQKNKTLSEKQVSTLSRF